MPRHENRLLISGKLKFSMYKYLNKLLEQFPHDMEGIVLTHQFRVFYLPQIQNVTSSHKKRQLFHHLVAKLLYILQIHDTRSSTKSYLVGKLKIWCKSYGQDIF